MPILGLEAQTKTLEKQGKDFKEHKQVGEANFRSATANTRMGKLHKQINNNPLRTKELVLV